MRFSVLVSLAALTAGAAASPTKRQDACAAQCNFEQEFCTFREAPACTKVCNAATYNAWVACHNCYVEAGDAKAEGMKTAIGRLSAGCLSTGAGLDGGTTSALATAPTGAPNPSNTAPPPSGLEAGVDAASPSPSSGTPAAASSAVSNASGAASSAASVAASAASSAAPAASSPATPAPAGALGRSAPVLAGFVGVAGALIFA